MTVTPFDLISPVDETVVQTVPFADRAEVDARVERAHRGFAAWRRVAPGDRARLLRRFAEAVDADIETLAALEVRNAGHTIGNARWEAGNVRDVLSYYAPAP
jgi:acyl-CoA reductase-like NAD-dependent aldehyde dehydrogenase